MPSTTKRYDRPGFARTLEHTFTAANQVSDWACLTGELAVQITGPATSIEVQIERSTRNPLLGAPAPAANIAPAGPSIVAAPATFSPQPYLEPGVAWWRARCVAITGASAVVAINGGGA
ncbi:hypothetical protein [Caulobacter segnis]|uniref:Uncharacterized protein n=1 Tax=Caulobacter segnis TaxID=88688 RepID=A0A2W5XH04_9CAUL|nr:hypothetical protein [Caulobacter segnis]PZR37161.1 MAG: hypothetical protein DI526_01200 [Caulobacter segnis]